jgi:hypothetical protein
MQILVVDVGGSEVKVLVTGQTTHRQFASSVSLTPIQMVSRVLKTAEGWKYDAMSSGILCRITGDVRRWSFIWEIPDNSRQALF